MERPPKLSSGPTAMSASPVTPVTLDSRPKDPRPEVFRPGRGIDVAVVRVPTALVLRYRRVRPPRRRLESYLCLETQRYGQ